MHLPATVRRRIVYAAGTVVLLGGLSFLPKSGASPVVAQADSPRNISALADATAIDPLNAVTAKDAPTPMATATQSARQERVEAPAAKPKIQTYKVVSGDDIGIIAAHFGLKQSTILWANDLNENDIIKINQELIIPGTDGLVRKVAEGDTLSGIAADYGADLEALVRANQDIDPGALQLGAVLIIPGGQPPTRRMVASSRGTVNRGRVTSFASWPASGPLTSYFGSRVHPVFGTRDFHNGIDVGVGVGTPVSSVASGTVTTAGWYGGYGNAVQIDHGNGVSTLYAHLSKISVDVGQNVAAGDRIGLSGSSGLSTGPHLHFVVFQGGSPVDPLPWLP